MQTDKENEISNDTIDLTHTIDDAKCYKSNHLNRININESVSNQKIENENIDIDEQVANSMRKLMEEETNVARAFVDQNGHFEKNMQNPNVSTGSNSVTDSVNNPASMHTQVIPDISRELEQRRKQSFSETERTVESEELKNTDRSTENSAEKTKNSIDKTKNSTEKTNNIADKNNSKNNSGKKLTKKKKIIIGVSVGVVVALLTAMIVTVMIVNNNNKKKSYQYNYDKGMQYYHSQDYSNASTYLKKAAESNEGQKNTDLLFDLYLCYCNLEEDTQALNTLKQVLEIDKYNQKAIQALASFYAQKEDATSLNALIKTYKGTDGEEYLSDYMVNNPAPSTEAGSYNENVKLQFVMDTDCTVYYTLDSSTPTNKSNLYKETIEIKSGTTTVKAVAVNSSGIYSDVVELKYEVDYKKPDAPSITPVSGTYEAGQMISVDNIPDGSKVYYTMDGSMPTDKSSVFSSSFVMPEGNTIVSAIIIDQNNQVSAVTKRNYVVNKTSTKKLTYDEALAILKTQLQNNGFLLADGSTTSTGGSATFNFQSEITVSGTQIYYIRYDVRANGVLSTQGYYGVNVKNGVCYIVTQSGSNYTLKQL